MIEELGLPTGKTSVKSFSVLLTGAGSPGAVGIIRYLKKFYKVIGVDSDPNASGFPFCDNYYIIPPAKEKTFIPALLEICGREEVKVLFPKCTAELGELSDFKRQFEEIGTKVMISDNVRTANNKYLLYKKLEGIVPVPEHFFSDGFCTKPVIGHGGEGFKKYEGKTLVMEYLPGDEYSVDILANQGEAITIVPRVRERVKAGVSVEGTVVMDKEIIELSRKAVKKLKLHGIVGLQFKRDKRFKPVLLECNPRIQGSIMLSEASGALLMLNAVNLATGQSLLEPNIRDGTKMRRYFQENYE